MRGIAILLALAASGCAGGPGALGITGPNPTGNTPQGDYGAVKLPSTLSSDDAAVLPPGVPVGVGTTYAPSIAPTYGDGTPYYGD
jgi:hypothetical protein